MIAWPFGGDSEAPTDFDFPNAQGVMQHISVPRPSALVFNPQSGGVSSAVVTIPSAQAYVNWIAQYLPEQAGKPGRTLSDLVQYGAQTGTEQSDFGQAKRYQYWQKTGYAPEGVYNALNAAQPTSGTVTAGAPVAQQTQAQTNTQAAAGTATYGSGSQIGAAAATGDGLLFGLPKTLVLIGLGFAAFMMLKGK